MGALAVRESQTNSGPGPMQVNTREQRKNVQTELIAKLRHAAYVNAWEREFEAFDKLGDTNMRRKKAEAGENLRELTLEHITPNLVIIVNQLSREKVREANGMTEQEAQNRIAFIAKKISKSSSPLVYDKVASAIAQVSKREDVLELVATRYKSEEVKSALRMNHYTPDKVKQVLDVDSNLGFWGKFMRFNGHQNAAQSHAAGD